MPHEGGSFGALVFWISNEDPTLIISNIGSRSCESVLVCYPQNGYYSSNIISNIFGRKRQEKSGKRGGKIRKRRKTKKNQAEIGLFTSTIQMVRKSSRTELCSPNFGPPKIAVFRVPKISLDIGEVFRFSVVGGFPGSGTVPSGFYGKFQYQTTRFLWRLLTAVSRKFGTQDFFLNVWRIPRCSFNIVQRVSLFNKYHSSSCINNSNQNCSCCNSSKSTHCRIVAGGLPLRIEPYDNTPMAKPSTLQDPQSSTTSATPLGGPGSSELAL